MFDKDQLQQDLLQALQALVDNARSATLRAYETATHEENIAENKYDTLGLEAAYLTQGQARRLAQCEADLKQFQHLQLRPFAEDDPIAAGALIQLEDERGSDQWLLLGPAAGGLKFASAGQDIMVVTPAAPLGKALLNRYVDESVTVQVAGRPKQYAIVAIF